MCVFILKYKMNVKIVRRWSFQWIYAFFFFALFSCVFKLFFCNVGWEYLMEIVYIYLCVHAWKSFAHKICVYTYWLTHMRFDGGATAKQKIAYLFAFYIKLKNMNQIEIHILCVYFICIRFFFASTSLSILSFDSIYSIKSIEIPRTLKQNKIHPKRSSDCQRKASEMNWHMKSYFCVLKSEH